MRLSFVLGLGIVLGLIGASLLVAFGVLYVKPFMMIRTMESSTCTVMYSFVLEDPVTCTCANGGSGCISQYPCLRILVNFTTTETSPEINVQNVTMYNSYDTFQLQGTKLQCSYHKCTGDLRHNIKSVKLFSDLYSEPGKQVPCWYEPSEPTYAIIEVISSSEVLHCMLWPTIALITGFTILIFYVFNIGPGHAKKTKHHFNSLERPWARYADRDYERVANDGRALVES